ncbi:hypothetical protein [Lysinibacillus antri]|uniref:Uncharacterized protein n=1 Tax=Lysinibacillus antri TaxID=2498145 RepID=A0A3S0P2I2_9BACI|nr:hypothetical protein [Lysinibacillus antri]RUL48815.1 hypothetical protein EK386_16400 [Lysinibacillus antri]
MKSSLIQNVQLSNIHEIFEEIFSCFTFSKNSEIKSNNVNIFAKLLVIAGDFTGEKVNLSFTVKPIKKSIIKAEDIKEMKDRLTVVSENGGLRKNINKLLGRQSYGVKHIALLKEWIPLIKSYINNSEINKFAEKVLNVSINIESEKLESLIKSLIYILNSEEEVMVMPTSPNKTINIITQEDLLDLIYIKMPSYLKEHIDFNSICALFPDFIILKGDVEVLAFYDEDEIEVELLVIIMETSSESGFEYSIGITEWEEESNLYSTEFIKVSIIGLAKFIEDLLREKNIDFIHYSVIKRLQNILNYNEQKLTNKYL